jgi:predicted nucleotidyltransferase
MKQFNDCALKSGELTHMDKEQVVSILREHEPELKAAGIVHLRLFGSVARGDASPVSDIDLMADLDKTKSFTLVSVGRLETRLRDILGVRVDLSSADWMREPVRTRAIREAVLAF